MKRCLALAVFLSVAFVAVPVAAEQASPTMERFVVPFDSVEPPHDCITEAVHYQGSYELTIITVYDGAGGSTRSLHYRQRISGTGLTTGNTYALQAQYSEVVHAAGDASGDVMTFPISYVEVSRGQGSKYLATGVLHLTVRPNGDIVSEVERGSIRCVG